MSFIFNIFSSNSTTASEKENAAALKAIIKDHKSALKAESQRYEAEYKQALKDAEAEYKQAKQQAKDNLHRNLLSAVKREVDSITATEAFVNSDAKTKSKIENFKAWVDSSAEKHLDEEDEELEIVEVNVDEKKIQSLAV
ncbi:hypothetical protein BGZ58_008953 [Dissophora ornata]|nr:hypothetical protein BGZ58_008953 [Dissophora ornata]